MKTALTIGFFDGVHLGHKAILQTLRSKPHATIVTFTNHPLEILHPPAPKLLIPFAEKLERLKPFADEIISIPFTKEFARIPFNEFLDRFDLSHIILGAGSAFGKNREGNEENIRKYADKKNIEVQFCPKVFFLGEPVSSSRIRKALEENNKQLASELLGEIL